MRRTNLTLLLHRLREVTLSLVSDPVLAFLVLSNVSVPKIMDGNEKEVGGFFIGKIMQCNVSVITSAFMHQAFYCT